MKKSTVILGFAALVFYKVLRSVKALKIRLKSYELGEINLTDGTIGMSLVFEINNPLWVGITLREISGVMQATSGENIETVGSVYNRYNYYIRGNATHNVRATLKVDSKSVLAAALQNINSGDINNLILTFDGQLVFGESHEVTLPIKRSMTIKELVGK